MAFSCQFCGHCCEGSGGIVLSESDLETLCAHCELSKAQFLAQYGERVGNKLRIRNGYDNTCIFFKEGVGCSVHTAKPDVCRAWPFFRGNFVDPKSLTLAKEYCPGISKQISFEDFVRSGLAYLQKHNLIKNDIHEATALHVNDLIKNDKLG